MQFNEIFKETWKEIGNETKVSLGSLDTSACPDSPMEFWIKGEFRIDGRKALALLAVLPFFGGAKNYSLIDSLRSHLGRMASNGQLQGEWKLVGEILSSVHSLDVYSTWMIILRAKSTNMWFGNLVPLMKEAIKAIKLRRLYNNVLLDKRPVIRPKRKRGYDDKGSMTPIHKWLPKYYPSTGTSEKKIVTVAVPRKHFWWGVYKGKGSG